MTCMILCKQFIFAQDVEQISKAPWTNANGGLSMSHIVNYSADTLFQKQPYAFFISGNLNTQLFGVLDLPLSFSYTNDQLAGSLPQPFNRFSMAPSYKWIKTYIGYTSMSFSPYSLSGHEFLGAGVELTPKEQFKFSAMYGRLNKAVNPDTLGVDPYYQRLGAAVKIDYFSSIADFSVNVLKAKDNPNSISFNNQDSIFVKPKDNLAGSAQITLKLVNNFSLMAEYALSAMNQDINQMDSTMPDQGGVFISNGDVAIYDAIKASISQKSKIGQIGSTYEKVSPNYHTLGAYYFNNDFENITANFSTNLIPRTNLAMNAGYQRDNLQEQKTSNSRRFIYAINAGVNASKKLNLNASVNNVQTYVHIKDIYEEVSQTNPYQNLDTLSFTQLNLTAMGNANYILQANKNSRQNINASFTYQRASEIQFDDTRYTGNEIYNSMLSYQYSLIPLKLNVSSTANFNYNVMPTQNIQVLSVNFSLRKTFLDKIKAGLTTTVSHSAEAANVINTRLSGGYIWLERHNLNLGLSMVNIQNKIKQNTTWGANLTYSYMFNCQLKRENKKFNFEGNF